MCLIFGGIPVRSPDINLRFQNFPFSPESSACSMLTYVSYQHTSERFCNKSGAIRLISKTLLSVEESPRTEIFIAMCIAQCHNN